MSLPTPTLHTARLLLRPFLEADADALFVLHSSPRVLRYWDAPPWTERARAERFIAVCRQIEQEGETRLPGHHQPAAMPAVEIQDDGVRRSRLVPGPRGADFVAGQHGQMPSPVQNRK